MRIIKRPLISLSSSTLSITTTPREGRRFLAAGRFLVVLIVAISTSIAKSSCSSRRRSTNGLSTTTTTTSTEQLAAETSQLLLFWSLHDCAIDAALQFLGPIDIFLRNGGSGIAAAATTASSDNDDVDNTPWALFASPVSSNHNTNASVEDICEDDDHNNSQTRLEQQQQQQQQQHAAQTLLAKGRAIVRDLKKNVSISSMTTTTTTDASSLFDVSSSSSSSTSLEIRGGGPGGWRGGAIFGGGTNDKYVFSLYQKGDGSETDTDGIPKRYLDMHNGNREMAIKSLQATLQWRNEYHIDTILRDPHPKYDLCKKVFPHYFLGRGSSDNRVVFMQRPALLNMKMANENKLTKQQLLMHYVYVNEYLWQIVEASNPLQMMTSVIDLTGLDLSVLRQRDNIAFLKLFVATMDSHYPQRAHKTLILNAPKWFSTLYKLLSPFLRDATKAKIEIHQRNTKKQDDAIIKYLGPNAKDVLPPSFFSINNKNNNNNNNNKSNTTGNSTNNNNKTSLPFWKRKRGQAQVRPSPQDSNDEDDVDDNVNDENNDNDVDDNNNHHHHHHNKKKEKKLTREEEKERLRNEAPPIVSKLEDDLRTFTLQRLKDAGKSMQKVV